MSFFKQHIQHGMANQELYHQEQAPTYVPTGPIWVVGNSELKCTTTLTPNNVSPRNKYYPATPMAIRNAK